MRKAVAIATTAALVVGFSVAGAAYASVTAPAANSTIAGTVTFTESPGGAKTGTLCVTGGNPATSMTLSGNGITTTTLGSNGGGVLSVGVDTHAYPNGTYTVTGSETNVTGTIICSGKTTTSTISVKIDNVVNIGYSGATSAPQNTTLAVSATLTDPNLATSVLAGRVLTFALGGGTSVQATTGSNGVATANLPISGPPRATTLAISYAGTTFYDAKTQNVAFNVTQDPTATTVSPTTATAFGQPVGFTANVGATAGGGTPTGSVQFAIDGTDYGSPVALVNGVATTPTTSTLAPGNHAITAVYSGDSNYSGSSSASVNQEVDRATTSTSLAAVPTSSVHGQAVTFTATVGVTGAGAGNPSGGVQFDIDGQPFGTAVGLTGNTAQLTISNLSTAAHTVTATYDGDTDFAPSTSDVVNENVGQAGTTTALTSSDDNAVYGESLTYTADVAAVTPGSGTPTGTVQFEVDGNDLGDPVTLVDGEATSPAASVLGPGAHDVTASYSGDGDFNGSNADYTQNVAQASTTTAVVSSVNPSVFGQPVTYTATVAPVAPGSGTPTGTVQFSVGGNPLGDPVSLVNGSATSDPIASLEPGTYIVSVTYSGDTDFVASTSPDLTQTVNKAATTTSVSSDVNPSVFGQPVTFTASVAANAPGAGNPTGTITFTDGSTVLGTEPVGPDTGEMASVTTSALVVAPHAIVAKYSGDTDFLASSDSLTQTVTRAQSSTLVASSADPSVFGQPVTFTASVAANAPGAGNPTGTVNFTVNGAPLGSAATLVNGVATSTTFASLSPGNYTIAASYSGDGNFVGSSATLGQGTGQNISQGATTTSVATSGSPANYATAVNFTATVSSVAPASGTPSGLVDFFEGNQLLGAASLASAGSGTATATFAYSSLPTGAHTITATYVGNYNFTGSSNTVSQSINSEPTAVGLTSSVNPTSYEGGTVFTAVVTAPSGTPTGSITFTDGSTVLGTVPLSVVQGSDQATLAVSSLHAGAHTITATYSGGGVYAGSSDSLTQTVAKAATQLVAQVIITDQVALQRDGARLDLGIGEASAYLTANGHGIAGQTIVFTTHGLENPSIPVCTAVTDANGYAHCDVAVNDVDNNLTVIVTAGGYQAAYAGDSDYQGATAWGGLDQ